MSGILHLHCANPFIFQLSSLLPCPPLPFLDLRGDPIPQEQVLGCGSSAVVLLQNGLAVKTPLRYLWSSDSEIEMNIDSVRREQKVYRRLQNPDDASDEDDRANGIVRCVRLSTEAIQLAYMVNRDLRTYLAANNRPSSQLQLKWFREMARTLGYIHDRRVLVADIASRNFLLLKICDFSEASLLAADADMDAVDENGYTTRIDIGLLGTVIYEVMTGKKREVDLFKNNFPSDGRAYWPAREFLPSTRDIWLGSIIEGCWDGEFRSAQILLQALDSIDLCFNSQSRTNPTHTPDVLKTL